MARLSRSSGGSRNAFRPYAGIIFDLDGTLLDTLGDIGNATNAVLVAHGFPTHPIPQYRAFVGEGVRVLMTRALPPQHRDEATLATCLETLSIEYPRHLNETARPYPGVKEMLQELRKRSWRLAVLSNKPNEFTARCVVEFFGRNLFNPILGLSPERPRKPDPAGALLIAETWKTPPDRILYVGDSGTDMQTATRAGMEPIGVLWGYRDRKELIALGARHLIESPQQLLETSEFE